MGPQFAIEIFGRAILNGLFNLIIVHFMPALSESEFFGLQCYLQFKQLYIMHITVKCLELCDLYIMKCFIVISEYFVHTYGIFSERP